MKMRYGLARRKRGFTLVELMVTVVAASIVAMAIGALVVSANRALLRHRRVTDMQRDAALTVQVLSQFVRESVLERGEIERTVRGDLIEYSRQNDSRESIVWDRAQREIRKEPSGLVLVDATWDIVDFSITEHTVTDGLYDVAFVLRDAETGKQMDMSSLLFARSSL
jgi:prepilin-type N-terminal cleavage/methylation domain-containing protein